MVIRQHDRLAEFFHTLTRAKKQGFLAESQNFSGNKRKNVRKSLKTHDNGECIERLGEA